MIAKLLPLAVATALAACSDPPRQPTQAEYALSSTIAQCQQGDDTACQRAEALNEIVTTERAQRTQLLFGAIQALQSQPLYHPFNCTTLGYSITCY